MDTNLGPGKGSIYLIDINWKKEILTTQPKKNSIGILWVTSQDQDRKEKDAVKGKN